jgi:tRNA U34 5-methylaminomethyl-2-thiouridine-forming methyltransferase MnmC
MALPTRLSPPNLMTLISPSMMGWRKLSMSSSQAIICPSGIAMDSTSLNWALARGLNLLVSLAAWRRSGQSGVLHYTSFEAFPLSPEQMITAQEAFEPLQELASELAPLWGTSITLADLRFELILGDARDILPKWSGKADAWFLDGFSPAKNPELWEASLMADVAAHTKTGGSCATYTAAGFVRRGLQAGGFEITRCPGFGRKKHMTRGFKP